LRLLLAWWILYRYTVFRTSRISTVGTCGRVQRRRENVVSVDVLASGPLKNFVNLALRKLYSLTTPHDSYLQPELARESLRDSKAMKSLSILTILFRPGAFAITLISTDMFSFANQMQEIRIYFAVVVPLTAILTTTWLLWL